MRACLAKDLRNVAKRNMPNNLSDEPRYVPVPRTARLRFAYVPEVQANGTIQMVKVEMPTVTFRLAPDCSRYYTQKLKRAYKKGIR